MLQLFSLAQIRLSCHLCSYCRWNFSVGEHEISLVKSQINPGSRHRITTAPVPDSSIPVVDDDDAYVTDCSDEHTGTHFGNPL